ncbi:MAG: hypothetical protein HZRFUVUK_000783 [Candidatus Fervidibacterota bacterium]
MRRSLTRKALLRDIKIRQLRTQLKNQMKSLSLSLLRWLWEAIKLMWKMIGIKAQDAHVCSLISQKHDELKRLGEKCYELYLGGELVHEDLLVHLKRIEELDAKVKAWKMERKILLSKGLEAGHNDDEHC